MTVEQMLLGWRSAERAALQAEVQLNALGQLSADPNAAQLAVRAGALRKEADRLFLELLRVLTGESRQLH